MSFFSILSKVMSTICADLSDGAKNTFTVCITITNEEQNFSQLKDAGNEVDQRMGPSARTFCAKRIGLSSSSKEAGSSLSDAA